MKAYLQETNGNQSLACKEHPGSSVSGIDSFALTTRSTPEEGRWVFWETEEDFIFFTKIFPYCSINLMAVSTVGDR